MTIFVFFGHPGAGKTTLTDRFAELNGIRGIDTDQFMTPEEREAAAFGRYTQAMRHANIQRYADHIKADPACRPHVALADGLPTDASRRLVLDQFPEASIILVLVKTPGALWEERLEARKVSLVNIGVTQAEAYIRANWEPMPADIPCEHVVNGRDPEAVDAQLRSLWTRFT